MSPAAVSKPDSLIGGSFSTPFGTRFFGWNGDGYSKVPMKHLWTEYLEWESRRLYASAAARSEAGECLSAGSEADALAQAAEDVDAGVTTAEEKPALVSWADEVEEELFGEPEAIKDAGVTELEEPVRIEEVKPALVSWADEVEDQLFGETTVEVQVTVPKKPVVSSWADEVEEELFAEEPQTKVETKVEMDVGAAVGVVNWADEVEDELFGEAMDTCAAPVAPTQENVLGWVHLSRLFKRLVDGDDGHPLIGHEDTRAKRQGAVFALPGPQACMPMSSLSPRPVVVGQLGGRSSEEVGCAVVDERGGLALLGADAFSVENPLAAGVHPAQTNGVVTPEMDDNLLTDGLQDGEEEGWVRVEIRRGGCGKRRGVRNAAGVGAKAPPVRPHRARYRPRDPR